MSAYMDDLLKFEIVNKLKSVYRDANVGDRKESSAEHTWSCLMLADYFFDEIDEKVDRRKVYEILMYHDLVEVESGDTPFRPDRNDPDQEKKEALAAKKLKPQLPKHTGDKFIKLFNEFEEMKTIEAKFAKAIDQMDSLVYEYNFKYRWKGWSKEFIIKKKEKYFKPFPKLLRIFHDFLDLTEKEGYYDQ